MINIGTKKSLLRPNALGGSRAQPTDITSRLLILLTNYFIKY